MAPKAKPTPHRLGPPPQLNSLKVPVVHQKFAKKVQPKLQEVVSRHIKILAKWFHTQFSWKKFLMLTYLPATTVLHILLIPNDYPLPYIITDAVTTLLAIVTMFLLLRMECSQILHEAEELWQQQPPAPGSDAGTNSTTLSSGASSPQIPRHVIPPIVETVASPQYQIGYPSMDERERREINNNNMGYEEAIDLEPIDFEHFIDEPDLDRPHMEKMFRVTYGEGPMRGR